MTWITLFFINWVANILIVEFLCIRKLKPVLNVNEARDSKYPAFRRFDTFWYNRLWLFACCHLLITKALLLLFSVFCLYVTFKVVPIGVPKNRPITGVRYGILRVA